MKTSKKKLSLILFCALVSLSSSMVIAEDRGGNHSGGMSITRNSYRLPDVSISILDNSSFSISFNQNFGLVEIIVLDADGSDTYAYVETVDTSIFNERVINVNSTNDLNVIIKDSTGAIINE